MNDYESSMGMQNHGPLSVSIIIPTYNRAESLALTLGSLTTQKFPWADYEILVVDNASTDSTRLVTESLSRDNPHHQILYFYESVPGLLSGRHRGAIEARGTFLVFVDDDIDADPRWLQAIVETFADSSVKLVGGRNLPRYATTPPSWLDNFWATTPYGGRACVYLSLLDLGENMLDIDANYVWGLNFAICRRALFDLRGFHPDIVPDHLQHCQGDGETGLTRKANTQGYRAVYQPRALVHHRIPASRLTPGYFERRAFYQGVCDSFTTIRQSRAVTVSQIVREAPHEAAGLRLVRYTWHLVRHPHSFAYRILRRLVDLKVKHIRERIQSAYQAGYDFHQNAVKGNPVLLEWVLRENYWDYHLPELLVPLRTNRSSRRSCQRSV